MRLTNAESGMFRYRLVAEARGCTLVRTFFGLPWSRRSFGRRGRIIADIGWDWEELSIVPDPENNEDRFVVMETPFCSFTWDDLEACARVADREIERVVMGPHKDERASPYRTWRR